MLAHSQLPPMSVRLCAVGFAIATSMVGCSSVPAEPAQPASVEDPRPTRDSPPTAQAKMETATAVPPQTREAAVASFSIGDAAVELHDSGPKCSVRATLAGAEPVDVPLELEPPCYWLRWTYDPPARAATSGGVARGMKDEPIAWHYDSMHATALVVVGGPNRETDGARLQKMAEHHCGQRTQAVLLGDAAPRASARVAEGSTSCERSGSDEREFWLFTKDDG